MLVEIPCLASGHTETMLLFTGLYQGAVDLLRVCFGGGLQRLAIALEKKIDEVFLCFLVKDASFC